MAEAPRTELSLVEHLLGAAERWPDRPAWTFDLGAAGRTTWTFAQVAAASAAYAGALAERGVTAGDRVAVMLGNVADSPLLWLALQRLGAATVPLNVRYRHDDLAHVLSDSEARLVVAAPEHHDLVRSTGGVAVLAPHELVADLGTAAERSADVVGDQSTSARPDPDTVVNVQYTSGTTGRPKGCLLTHRYWTTLGASMLEEFPHLDSDDVMLTAQPFHYVDPQWNVATALMAGAHLVALDGFHPSTFWAHVREHEVTYFYCLASMPTLLLRMPPDPADRDHRVRAVQCSAIPPALHADLEARWGVGWYEAFGMTETGADIRVGEQEHAALVGTGCLGRPAAHREVRVDPTGQLWLRGPGMMRGYLGLDSPFDPDGWFPTGDLARLDDQGRVYLTGRLKDMIRRSGENIAAVEVEEVLLSHPEVRLAAVVGVPDDVRGEEVMAYVVAPGTDADSLAAWCAARLAPFKVPSRWALRESLPLTASHRVEKAVLRAETAAPGSPTVHTGPGRGAR
ncbi:Long-chain-fatty-acid--CoA ligase [Nocardioides dokdonensis FR1436]|uniref:Long-chain-fatty-acid--CoA ligase n=1 Tax=Nocardioides dokdonensis FR1436 TaxID=1300347 RepID=A0A1A9GQJ2_9ACTN|nr:AMP-binding protein [Nocardioides dokdonensis]ANH39705.1 Long-chain-fatty-acid--CoA ligase [Nocardioides dokdonensis FR1436]